jgi:hypothetical protein
VVARHRRITHGKDQQEEADHDVRERNPRAVSEKHGDRRSAAHGGERRSS